MTDNGRRSSSRRSGRWSLRRWSSNIPVAVPVECATVEPKTVTFMTPQSKGWDPNHFRQVVKVHCTNDLFGGAGIVFRATTNARDVYKVSPQYGFVRQGEDVDVSLMLQAHSNFDPTNRLSLSVYVVDDLSTLTGNARDTWKNSSGPEEKKVVNITHFEDEACIIQSSRDWIAFYQAEEGEDDVILHESVPQVFKLTPAIPDVKIHFLIKSNNKQAYHAEPASGTIQPNGDSVDIKIIKRDGHGYVKGDQIQVLVAIPEPKSRLVAKGYFRLPNITMGSFIIKCQPDHEIVSFPHNHCDFYTTSHKATRQYTDQSSFRMEYNAIREKNSRLYFRILSTSSTGYDVEPKKGYIDDIGYLDINVKMLEGHEWSPNDKFLIQWFFGLYTKKKVSSSAVSRMFQDPTLPYKEEIIYVRIKHESRPQNFQQTSDNPNLKRLAKAIELFAAVAGVAGE